LSGPFICVHKGGGKNSLSYLKSQRKENSHKGIEERRKPRLLKKKILLIAEGKEPVTQGGGQLLRPKGRTRQREGRSSAPSGEEEKKY